MGEMIRLENGRFIDTSYETLAEDAAPCPFCGFRYIRTKNEAFYKKTGAHEINVLEMHCMDCSGEAMAFVPAGTDYKDAYKCALEKWNRRTPS